MKRTLRWMVALWIGAMTAGMATVGDAAVQTTAAPPKNTGAPSGTITIGVPDSLSGSMLPFVASSSGMQTVVGQQFATLLHLGQNLSVSPELVTKWWYADQGKAVYMLLNPAAVWSDGTPITSADVGLCVNFLASPTYNNVLQGNQGYRVLPIVGAQAEMNGSAKTVSGFHVVNAHEFYFQLNQADPSVLASDLQGLMPLPTQILGQTSMAGWNGSAFAQNPTVGSGPFLLQSRTGGMVSLTANKTFILGQPLLQGLNYKTVPPIAVRGLFTAGAIDLYANIPISDVNQFQGLANTQFVSVPGNQFSGLIWNDQGSVASQTAFRQAVMYAISRQSLITNILKGQATVDNGPIPPDSIWYNTGLTQTYGYNPQQARNILIQAGFHIGGQGWLVAPNGLAMTTTINYAAGDPFGQAMAQAIASDLRAIAINAQARGPLSIRDMVTEMGAHTNALQGFLMGWQLGPDPNPSGLWRSTDVFNSNTFNWTNTTNQSVQQSNQWIAAQASQQAESNSYRQNILFQWQTLINQQAPVDFLYDFNTNGVMSSRLQGVVWSGYQGPIDSWKWSVTPTS